MKQTKYVIVGHELNKDFWASKKALFEAFYGEFYNFIKKSEEGLKDLESHNIKINLPINIILQKCGMQHPLYIFNI